MDQYRIHIIFGTLKDVTPFICYFDTGKGFSKYIVPELPRWLAKGPTEEEHEQGYGYWLIGKILSHIKGKFAFTIYEQDGNLNTTLLPADIRINELSKLIQYVSNNLLEEMKLGNLCEDNVRLIHWFIFETA